MHAALLLSLPALLAQVVVADVTVYGFFGQTTVDPNAAATGTVSAEPSTTSFVTTPGPPHFTELAAYNNIYLEPPAIPSPAPATQFAIGVPTSAQLMNGLSIPQSGSFFGFSIEMSVANQLSKSCLRVMRSERRLLELCGLLITMVRVVFPASWKEQVSGQFRPFLCPWQLV